MIFNISLKKVIDDSIGEIYGCRNAYKLYLSSFRYMKMFFHFFNYDSLGIKLKLYRIIDKITPASFKRLEELSFYRDYNSDLSYLNLEHSKWVYPWDDKKVFYSSFFDLYDDALESAVLSITSIVDMFMGRLTTTSGTSYFCGKMNDVRIYNHALSPQEVEKISQGLVLHY